MALLVGERTVMSKYRQNQTLYFFENGNFFKVPNLIDYNKIRFPSIFMVELSKKIVPIANFSFK